MSKLILAIDPGETTGWAFGRANARKFTLEALGEISVDDFEDTGKYSQYRKVAFTLMEIVSELEPQVVIIEDFTLRQMTTTKPEGISPVRIGAMLDVWLHEIMPLHWRGSVTWHTAAQKDVVNNARMKAAYPELYQASAGIPHARDAIRHCEVYRRKMS